MSALEFAAAITAGIALGGFVELLQKRYGVRPLSRQFWKASALAVLALAALFLFVKWTIRDPVHRSITELILNFILLGLVIWLMPRSEKPAQR